MVSWFRCSSGTDTTGRNQVYAVDDFHPGRGFASEVLDSERISLNQESSWCGGLSRCLRSCGAGGCPGWAALAAALMGIVCTKLLASQERIFILVSRYCDR